MVFLVFAVAVAFAVRLPAGAVTVRLLSFAVARAAPGARCNWQLKRPGWFARHEVGKFFCAAEAERHLGYDLIMHM